MIHFSSCKKPGGLTPSRSARNGWLLHTPALRAGKQRAEGKVQGGGTASTPGASPSAARVCPHMILTFGFLSGAAEIHPKAFASVRRNCVCLSEEF